jgi:hypothetical protein
VNHGPHPSACGPPILFPPFRAFLGQFISSRWIEAVTATWQQDRARRAQAGRLSANILNYGVDEAQMIAEEVLELGRRLFTDRLGPLTFYPTGAEYDEGDTRREPTTSFAGPQATDLDRPAALVLRLQSTLLGCEWLLGEWAALKAILDQGQPWVPSDKLKAVRLLGKQPFDAIDDKDVAMVFLASFVLKEGAKGRWFWEIEMETTDDDLRRFRLNAADRQLELLKPKNAAEARQALLGIIDRATERLTAKAETHRERARVMASLAPDFLAFDASPDGERLRRFDLASGRALARSLAELRKHRREARNVSGPLLSVVGGTLEARDESGWLAAMHSPSLDASPYQPDAQARVSTDQMTPDAHYQPDAQAREPEVHHTLEGQGLCPSLARRVGVDPNVSDDILSGESQDCGSANETNEPTIGPFSVVRGPLPMVGCAVEQIGEQNSTNEPTIGSLSVGTCVVEAIDEADATNEPTEARKNETKEP